MNSLSRTTALLLGLLVAPALAAAQTSDTSIVTAAPFDTDEPVLQYDLSGPRLGATFQPDGTARSQFGWHFEHQAAPGKRGPWFIVETVLLVGGVESDLFIPNATMIFGLRLPNSFEFGVGPSLTLGGSRYANTAVVVAAGHSFRAGGIRVPVNVAVALDKDGDERVSVMTGWAIRDHR